MPTSSPHGRGVLRSWLGYLVVAVAGGLAGALFVSTREPPRAAGHVDSPSVSVGSSSDQAAIGELSRRIAMLERARPAERTVIEPRHGDEPRDREEEPPSVEELEERRVARAESFEIAFEHEVRDDSWARTSERELSRRFVEAGLPRADFECARSLCRAQLAIPEGAAGQTAQLLATHGLTGFSAVDFAHDADGTHTVVYAVRQGYALPLVAN